MSEEKVKLDEVLKFLFTTSKEVLLGLLNGIFEESYSSDEVEIEVTNNEFVMETLETIRGDVFFRLLKKHTNKITYHLEFQTKNDSTMVIRMFEYGFFKGKEEASIIGGRKTVQFPKQKVIFIEENNNIPDSLEMDIILSEDHSFTYRVPVIKYWKLSDQDIIENGMYPLLPLKLFNLRKEIHKAYKNNNIDTLRELTNKSKIVAEELAYESKELFDENKILGEDFHKMLLAIQNLIEYLNRVYFNNEEIEEEVEKVTKTLFDPEVEKRGIEKGIEKGMLLVAKNLLDILDDKTISLKTELPLDVIKDLRKKNQM